MIIDFEEKDHVYLVNGEIAGISVTELLSKHGLAPDYSGVDKEKIKESAAKGKEVHKDLENILNERGYLPKTKQGENFAQWVKDNLDCGVGEQKLAYEYNGLIIAGTADIMGITKDKNFIVADHKNTSKFHREYVSWQVSLLDYFARKLGKEKVNGKLLNWKGATKFYCFHYEPKTGEMNVYELERVSDQEIERLIECEYSNEKYQRKELVVSPELQDKFLQAEKYLAEMEFVYKQAEANAKRFREEMLQLFEKQKIVSWESPSGKVKVTYVAQSESPSVDSAKLKTKYPQVFSECQKLTKRKSYVKVKIREDEEDF